MNSKEYQNVTFLRGQYVFIPYTGTVTKEDLLFIYNCSEDELDQYISPDEIEFVQEWMNEGGSFDYIVDIIKSDFSKMTRDEISQNIDEFIDAGIYDREVLGSVPDVNLVIDKFENLSDDNKLFFTIAGVYTIRGLVANSIGTEDFFRYLNENGKASDAVIDFLAKETTTSVIANAMTAIKLDSVKTKILIKCNEEIKQQYTHYINEAYYKNQVLKSFEIDEAELITQVDQYSRHLQIIDSLDDESRKTEYISNLTDRDMKQFLLSKLKERQNRDTVINSFTRYVDPEIKDVDKLMQTMIREFFEDTLGEHFTEDKRERLDIVFNRVDIKFQDLTIGTNGLTRLEFRDILVTNKYRGNINKTIGVLAHEYAHLLSNFNFMQEMDIRSDIIEEGMADTFADLVINHYDKKHKGIFMNGKRISVDSPYAVKSVYDFENAWSRTILAGLESSGKDYKAIGEYFLGNKIKYIEMILGAGIVDRMNDNTSSYSDLLDITKATLYYSPELDFSNIDKNSIYYNRNYILPLYLLQQRLKNRVSLVDVPEEEMQYPAAYIAKEYFGERKFYEVPSEELGEFIELIHRQESTRYMEENSIGQIDEYENGAINELTYEEIKAHSFEILTGISELLRNSKAVIAGDKVEEVIKHAFEQERKKIEEGQPIEVTRQKRERIVNRYKELFKDDQYQNNDLINDYINAFELECEEAEYRQDGNIALNSQEMKILAREEGVPDQKSLAIEGIKAIQNNREQHAQTKIKQK